VVYLCSVVCDSLLGGESVAQTPVGTRLSIPIHTNPKAHPVSCRMGTASLSQGMALTTHPHLALRLQELYLYTSSVPS